MTIEQIHISNRGSNYIAVINNKAYEINKYFYYILSSMKRGGTKEDAINDLAVQESFNESESVLVKKSFDNFISKLPIGKENTSYIKFSITVFREKATERISKIFLWLFHKYTFIIMLALSLASNILYLFYINDHSEYRLKFSLSELWILFILSNICIIFHEIGHSTASLKYKLPSKKIGFGFYFIFPVFFSDVTSIWLLKKRGRIIVNMAGIYFQLIINLLLISLFFCINDSTVKGILLYFITSNLFIIVYSAIPFFRNDGYWIYSDLFNIPNLLKRSDDLVLRFLTKEEPGKNRNPKHSLPLILYTLTNWIFKFYIIYRLLMIIINNIGTIQYNGILYDAVMGYLGIGVSIIGIYMILRNIKRILNKKTQANESI